MNWETAFGALTILLVLSMVLTRVVMLRRRGITALKFGQVDKTDFFIPPFALFYFYLIFAGAFGWPTDTQPMWHSTWLAWLGVVCCAVGVFVLLSSLSAFGSSFRIGIDTDKPDRLITSGIFARTRNPIYVGFAAVLTGEFLIQPTWVMLLYLGVGIALFHRQVLREEAFMRQHYGAEYDAYVQRAPRYL